jgi:hypothetical protein
MATTPTHAIVYPVVGNTITPLATHFANLANSTDSALTALGNTQSGLIGTDAARLALTGGVKREGLNWYSNDTNRNYFYDGTTWLPNDSGSILLFPSSVVGATIAADGATIPTTGATVVSVNGVFSTRFRKYRVEFYLRNSSNVQMLMRLRAAGTDNSSANYTYTSIEYGAGGIVGAGNVSQTSFHTTNAPNQNIWGTTELTNPAHAGTNVLKTYTGVFASAIGGTSNASSHRTGMLAAADGSTFDGFSFTGLNIDGSASWIKVYGLT